MWRPCARTAKVVDKQLEYGLDVEAMMLLRPGGEDWVGASPHGAAVGVFFLCPSVLFPLRRRRRFCQEVFYGKFYGYSKYVCCITAPCVRINIA